MLARKGQPLRHRLRSGLTLLADMAGAGEPVRRQHRYRIRLRLWLNKGQAVRWQSAWGPVGLARLDVSGLFYGVEGMRVGGTRRAASGLRRSRSPGRDSRRSRADR